MINYNFQRLKAWTQKKLDHHLTAFSNGRNYIQLLTLTGICNNYHIPDRLVATIKSTMLKDISIISETEKSLIIAKNKIRRVLQHNQK